MILDGARWLGRAFHPGGLPIQLTFLVTSRCQARCAHCFYGEHLGGPAEDELSLGEIDRVARGLPRLLWVALGGGEPFLRRDLAAVAATFVRHNHPVHLTLVTNGLDPPRVERVTREILSRRATTRINVAVSLDGLEAVQDRERGVPGNFRRARETLLRLCGLRRLDPGLGVTTLTTVHPRNRDGLEALERWIDEEIHPDSRGINLVRGRPLDPSLLDPNRTGWEETLEAYHEAVARKRRAIAGGRLPLQRFPLAGLNAAKDRVVAREVERVARGGGWRAPCRAGRVGAVLYENGDVAACEVLDRRIGNIRDFGGDLARLWRSDAAEELRRVIDETRCRCTWECAQATNVLLGPRHWPALLREWFAGPGGPEPSPSRAPAAGGRAGGSGAALDPALDRLPAGAPRSVTVLVPCRDEALVIRRKVRNCLRLGFPDPAACEVLIIDDGSSDGTASLVAREIAAARGIPGGEIAGRGSGGRDSGSPMAGPGLPSLRLLHNRHVPGKAGVIRTGLEAARGDVVLLTDADVLLERGALARALAAFDDPATGVVSGEQVLCDAPLPEDGMVSGEDGGPRPGGPITDPRGRQEGPYDRIMRGLRRLESRVDSTFAVHGQMMLFRRDLGLQPRRGIAADDVDLALQARRRGVRIRYAEGARFWEERPRTFRGELRQKARRGRAFAQVLWAHRDMLGDPRLGAFGSWILPFHWLLLLGQPIAVGIALAAGLAAAWVWAAPGAAAAAGAGIGLGVAVSREARSYLMLNALMLWGIVALLAGAGASDRWPRDREGVAGGAA